VPPRSLKALLAYDGLNFVVKVCRLVCGVCGFVCIDASTVGPRSRLGSTILADTLRSRYRSWIEIRGSLTSLVPLLAYLRIRAVSTKASLLLFTQKNTSFEILLILESNISKSTHIMPEKLPRSGIACEWCRRDKVKCK
jgi:hypothetical protein